MWISVAVMPTSVASGGTAAVVGAAAAVVALDAPVVALPAVVALDELSSRPPHPAAMSAATVMKARNPVVRFIQPPVVMRCQTLWHPGGTVDTRSVARQQKVLRSREHLRPTKGGT